jgi:hypothetical protein
MSNANFGTLRPLDSVILDVLSCSLIGALSQRGPMLLKRDLCKFLSSSAVGDFVVFDVVNQKSFGAVGRHNDTQIHHWMQFSLTRQY